MAAGLTGTARADFSVNEVRARFNGDALEVSGSLTAELSEETGDALAQGVALEIFTEFALLAHRSLIWPEDLNRWSRIHELRFHALSNRYIVENRRTRKLHSFNTVAQALRHIGTINESLDRPGASDPENGHYLLEIRSRLNIEALPAPLRPVAYTSDAWKLDSGWTRWDVGS